MVLRYSYCRPRRRARRPRRLLRLAGRPRGRLLLVLRELDPVPGSPRHQRLRRRHFPERRQGPRRSAEPKTCW